MAKVYFGFAISDSMFDGECSLERRSIELEAVKLLVSKGVVPCLNPSHTPTIAAMRSRFGLEVEVPEKAPVVKMGPSDRLIVMGVRGLPRLEATRHEYTQAEIDSATFNFSIWEVVD